MLIGGHGFSSKNFTASFGFLPPPFQILVTPLHIVNFHQMLYSIRSKDDFVLELVGNMKETPTYFNAVPGHTIEMKCRKSTLIEPLVQKNAIPR